MRSLSASEVRRILAVIPPRSPFGARDRAMLVFLLHTGLRVSEICGLTVGDVYQWGASRRYLDLPASLGKLGKARLIPLNGTAREAVSALVQFLAMRGFSIAPTAPLLTNRKGQFLPVRTFQSLVQGYRERAGLSVRITPHAFRHTFATTAMATTPDPLALRALLGHSRTRTLEVYVHSGPDTLSKVVDAIG